MCIPRPCGCSVAQRDINSRWRALPRSAQAFWNATAARKHDESKNVAAQDQVPSELAGAGTLVRAYRWAQVQPWAPQPQTWSGDALAILSETEYRAVHEGPCSSCHGLEAQWRSAFNTPVGSEGAKPMSASVSSGGEQPELVAEQPRSCFAAGDCDRYPSDVREVAEATARVICQYLRSKSEASKLSAWRLKWCIPTRDGEKLSQSSACFLVAHALLSPYRVIVLRLLSSDTEGSLYTMGRADGILDFALLYDYVANLPIPWARDCLTIRLNLLSWEIETWDSLRVSLELQDHVIRDPAPQKGAGSWGALQVSTQALARLAATLQQLRQTPTPPSAPNMRRCPGQRQRRQARFNRQKASQIERQAHTRGHGQYI